MVWLFLLLPLLPCSFKIISILWEMCQHPTHQVLTTVQNRLQDMMKAKVWEVNCSVVLAGRTCGRRWGTGRFTDRTALGGGEGEGQGAHGPLNVFCTVHNPGTGRKDSDLLLNPRWSTLKYNIVEITCVTKYTHHPLQHSLWISTFNLVCLIRAKKVGVGPCYRSSTWMTQYFYKYIDSFYISFLYNLFVSSLYRWSDLAMWSLWPVE